MRLHYKISQHYYYRISLETTRFVDSQTSNGHTAQCSILNSFVFSHQSYFMIPLWAPSRHASCLLSCGLSRALRPTLDLYLTLSWQARHTCALPTPSSRQARLFLLQPQLLVLPHWSGPFHKDRQDPRAPFGRLLSLWPGWSYADLHPSHRQNRPLQALKSLTILLKLHLKPSVA